MSLQELRPMHDFLQTWLQEPGNFFCSQMTCIGRDSSCHIKTPTSHLRWCQERPTYCAWGVLQRVPSSVSSRILFFDVVSWAWTSRTPKIHGASRPLGTTATQRYDIPRDWLWDACHLARVRWGARCKGFCSEEGLHYRIEQRTRNPLEGDQVQRALRNFPEAVIGQGTVTLIHEFGNPFRIPSQAALCYLTEAYVLQESESSRVLFWVGKGMVHNHLTDVCIRNLRQKGGKGKKTGSESTTRFLWASCFEKSTHSVPETWGRTYDVFLQSVKGMRNRTVAPCGLAVVKRGN